MNLSQLQDLDIHTAGSWPLPAKVLAAIIVAVLIAFAGYMLNISDQLEQLNSVQLTEQQLRQEFVAKQRVMVNIDAFREQLEELQTVLEAMIRQLPTSTEMPDLLEDISNTGKTHGLTFELFKPQDEQPKELYAAKPIAIRARANYHQLGTFVGSIAALPRIVTLDNVSIVMPQQDDKNTTLAKDALLIEATLKTYRYLDQEEAAMETIKQ